MSGMEEDARNYLYKILMTLSVGALWMLTNMAIGIYGGWFFYEHHPKLGNYICYFILVLSLGGMLRYFYKIWR